MFEAERSLPLPLPTHPGSGYFKRVEPGWVRAGLTFPSRKQSGHHSVTGRVASSTRHARTTRTFGQAKPWFPPLPTVLLTLQSLHGQPTSQRDASHGDVKRLRVTLHLRTEARWAQGTRMRRRRSWRGSCFGSQFSIFSA